MEVHAHAPTPRKKWTHYFWEFLMLFLAVFCGFLAEYQLEHKIEKDRESVYIKNLYEDLKADTIIYSAFFSNASQSLAGIDSLIHLMKSLDRNTHLGKIYLLARIATIGPGVVYPNVRTFEEMKQGGQLRLISNRKVADSISLYYNSLNIIAAQNNFILERIGDYMSETGKVFDSEMLLKILKEKKEPIPGSAKLITEDPVIINQFLARAQYLYGSNTVQKEYISRRSEMAKNLIDLIKMEYHLSEGTPLEK